MIDNNNDPWGKFIDPAMQTVGTIPTEKERRMLKHFIERGLDPTDVNVTIHYDDDALTTVYAFVVTKEERKKFAPCLDKAEWLDIAIGMSDDEPQIN